MFLYKYDLVQVTTYGPLLTQKFKVILAETLKINIDSVKIFQLPDFDTEIDFCTEVR